MKIASIDIGTNAIKLKVVFESNLETTIYT